MNQTKTKSFIEVMIGTFIGYLTAIVTQIIVFPLFVMLKEVFRL